MTRFTPLWVQQGNYAASVDRGLINAIWPAQSYVRDMKPVPGGAAMVTNVGQGKAAVYINVIASVLCYSNGLEAVTHTAAHATLPRVDLVVVQVRANDLDGGSNNDWIVQAVAGTPAASPVAPATPAYAVAIAEVLIPAAFNAIIPAGNITDVRPRRMDQPWNTAWGVQAFVRVTTATANVSNVETDVAGLSVTLNTVANRRYRIFASVLPQSTIAGDISHIKITDQNNVIQHTARMQLPVVNTAMRTDLAYTTNPAAGPSTWKVRAIREGTGGVHSFAPNTSNYHELIVDDIGPTPGSTGTLLRDALDDRMEETP
jgi:hypothetical protein